MELFSLSSNVFDELAPVNTRPFSSFDAAVLDPHPVLWGSCDSKRLKSQMQRLSCHLHTKPLFSLFFLIYFAALSIIFFFLADPRRWRIWAPSAFVLIWRVVQQCVFFNNKLDAVWARRSSPPGSELRGESLSCSRELLPCPKQLWGCVTAYTSDTHHGANLI